MAEMSSRDFAEWRAYYNLEPFGDVRADARIAILTSVIANANRDPKRRRKPYTPEDFIPKFDQEQRQTQEEQLAIVMGVTAAMGGKDLRH